MCFMKKLLISITILAGLSACSKILDKTDLTGIDERTWDAESTATLYLNRLYDLAIPTWPCMSGGGTLPTNLHDLSDDHTGGDAKLWAGELSADNVPDFIGSGTSNGWEYIRRINILLTEIDKGALEPAIKAQIKAQAYFLRGWLYFQLVKLYGGVPYLNHPQDWVNENLYIPRNKTSECIDSIVRDFDMGTVLPARWPDTDRGRITRGAALAAKGRLLLFYASPQFNPTSDNARWKRAYAANKAAYDTLIMDGYALHPSFSNVLLDEGFAANKEVILQRSFDGASKPSTFEDAARPNSETSGGGGAYQPTWDLVKSFPMKNGLSITDAASGYDSVYYWKNRDPRFDATIAYNGCIWPLSNKAGRKQWTYVGMTDDRTKPNVTGFYCRKGLNTTVMKDNSKLGKTDWIEMRLAEVMLNLAECAAVTDNVTEAYDLVKAIRKRAGIVAGTDGLYGMPAGLTGEDLRLFIVKERRIEFAFEGKRYDDLRRNRLFHLLTGSRRQSLVVELKAPYKVNDFEKINPATGLAPRDLVDVNGPDYLTYFKVSVGTIDTQKPINFPEKYYFYGIPNSALLKNPALVQTENWDGNFKPLE